MSHSVPATNTINLIILFSIRHFKKNVEIEPKKSEKSCPQRSQGFTVVSQCEELAQMSSAGIRTPTTFSLPPPTAMRIPYTSQPTDCFPTINIQFGGGAGQVQMLDPKKPQSICSWLLKIEFLTSEDLLLCQETLAACQGKINSLLR
jgi:hypothetical protein